MRTNTRKWLFYLLHLAGFILLYFMVRDLQWKDFITVMKSFPLWKYGVGLIVLCLVYAMKALRWQLLNRAFGIKTTWKTTLVFYLSAGFLSVITPGRLGEFAKIYFLKRKYNVEIASATSSVILDRIWDILVLSHAAGISLVVLFGTPALNILSLSLIGLLFLVALSLVLLPSVLFRPLLFLVRRFSGLHGKVEEVFRLWKENRFSSFLTSLTISAVAFLMLASLPVLFSHGTCCPLSFGSGIGAISVSNILSFLPVTIAGFGTRELVFTEVWRLSHFSKEVAISVSTSYFMVTYLGSLLIGGVVYLFNLKTLYRPGEIRRMKDE
jgi:uncharacterized protein (TIRG00374 family)